MRKLMLFFLIVCIGALFAFSTPKVDENTNIPTFTGTIEEIYGQSAIVLIEEGDVLNAGYADVNLAVAEGTTFKVGDRIRVGHHEDIGESDPINIITIFVELLE